MKSIHNQIKDEISKKKRGSIIFAVDFRDFENGDSVRQALSRLCKEEFIVRLSQGIYLYPKINEELGIGILYPSIEEIAKAISKRDKSRLIPTGVYALNKLGLSTQVPMRVVFLTDGSSRIIKIGKKATVNFKKTVPKFFALKGEISTLVIFALKEIGKDNVSEKDLEKIKEALSQEKKELVIHDAAIAPEWISKIMLKLIKDE